MALLGKSIMSQSNSEPILKKIWCFNYWKGSSERHYLFNLKVGNLIQSTEANKIVSLTLFLFIFYIFFWKTAFSQSIKFGKCLSEIFVFYIFSYVKIR